MQLKSFVNDMGKITIVVESKSWLTANGQRTLWNVAPNTQILELLSCYSSAINFKRKGADVMLLLPLKFSSKELKDIKIVIESMGSECRFNFSNICRFKTLLI